MNYNSLRVKDGSIDTVPRMEISKEEVEAATQRVNELQNLPVKGTKNTGNGISFLGPYGIVLAKFTYTDRASAFEIRLNKNAQKQYQEAHRKEKNRRAIRKFVVCRVLPFGAAAVIGITSVVNLVRWAGEKIDLSPGNDIGVVDVADISVADLNEVDPSIVLAWADHAMGEYRESIEKSEYSDYIIGQYDNLYECSFGPMHSAYESYYEYKTSGLPQEMMGNSIETAYSRFRSNAWDLNDSLPSSYKFENSIYAKAVVLGEYDEDTHAYDMEVYVPLSEMGDTEFDVGNLPDDAVIHKGEIFVSIKHLHKLDKGFSK